MKKIILFSLLVLSGVLLFFAWYIFSPLFIDRVVDEKLPITEKEDRPIVEAEGIKELSNITLGSFVDADSFHKVSGEVSLVNLEERSYIRFEEFSSTNGPDLFVYLSKDLEAEEFIDLGELKGNIGNQNYELPEGTSLEEYPYVLIWCKQFSVLFGSAKIN